LAIQEAAKKGGKEDWVTLDKILSDESKRTKEERFDIGRKFHEEIWRISDNQVLQQMLATIFERIHRARWLDIFFTDRADNSFKEHVQVLNWLKKGKVDKAVGATQWHIKCAKENILRLLERKKNLLYIK
jgi:DNA-binding GntR family transcriptional regulator